MLSAAVATSTDGKIPEKPPVNALDTMGCIPPKSPGWGVCSGVSLFFRFLGLFITVSLIISPWLVAVNVQDPFLNQSWLILGLTILATTAMALFLPFYRPRRNQVPVLIPAIVFWIGIAISTMFSPYVESLRLSLTIACQLLILLFLRLSQKHSDLAALTYLLVLSGTLMAVFALFQRNGSDVFEWDSYKVVGTFSNPNFLGAYLLVTALLTLGLFFSSCPRPIGRVFLGFFLVVQFAGLHVAGAKAAWLCLAIGSVLLMTDIPKGPAKPFGLRGHFRGGIIFTVLFVILYGDIYLIVTKFNWNQLSTPPTGHFSEITRLLIQSMGFSVFLQSPWIGNGLGSSKFLLTAFRPEMGTFLGLSNYNDDPHSFFVSLLAETGIFGLFGFSLIICSFLAVHRWRKLRETAADDENFASIGESDNPETHTPSMAFSGYTPHRGDKPCLLLPPPTTGEPAPQSGELERKASASEESRGRNSFGRPGASPVAIPGKVFFIPGFALLLHSTFNNAMSIPPISNLLVLLGALHLGSCLREVRWQWRFSPVFFAYLFFPVLVGLFGWNFQSNHHQEVKMVFDGNALLAQKNFVKAAQAFEQALKGNSQSLEALWGLAGALEGQNRFPETQEVLAQIDSLAPNAFAVKFHIACMLFDRGLYLEAFKWARAHFEGNRSPSACELLGRIFSSVGRAAEAEEMYKEAVSLVPWWIEFEKDRAFYAMLQLAAFAIDRGKIPEARDFLRPIASGVARLPDFYYLKGVVELKSGNATAAIPFFEQAFEKSPKDSRFGNALGFALVETGSSLERAQTLLEDAYRGFRARTPPILSEILSVSHSLGILYWKLGQLKKAHELLYIAFSQCPDTWAAVKESRERDFQRFLKETGNIKSPSENIKQD